VELLRVSLLNPGTRPAAVRRSANDLLGTASQHRCLADTIRAASVGRATVPVVARCIVGTRRDWGRRPHHIIIKAAARFSGTIGRHLIPRAEPGADAGAQARGRLMRFRFMALAADFGLSPHVAAGVLDPAADGAVRAAANLVRLLDGGHRRGILAPPGVAAGEPGIPLQRGAGGRHRGRNDGRRGPVERVVVAAATPAGAISEQLFRGAQPRVHAGAMGRGLVISLVPAAGAEDLTLPPN